MAQPYKDEFNEAVHDINKPLLSREDNNEDNNRQQYGCFNEGCKVMKKSSLINEDNCDNKQKLMSNGKPFSDSIVRSTTNCNWLFNHSSTFDQDNKSKQLSDNRSLNMNKLLKLIGIILIVLLCIVCTYELWNLKKVNSYKTRIRMVNVISRHGDRK